MGLVNRVLPPTEANAYTQSIARKLAAKPISSLIETKRLMKQGRKQRCCSRWRKKVPALDACCANQPHGRLLRRLCGGGKSMAELFCMKIIHTTMREI